MNKPRRYFSESKIGEIVYCVVTAAAAMVLHELLEKIDFLAESFGKHIEYWHTFFLFLNLSTKHGYG